MTHGPNAVIRAPGVEPGCEIVTTRKHAIRPDDGRRGRRRRRPASHQGSRTGHQTESESRRRCKDQRDAHDAV
jgi:hypothetical protein